MSLFLLYLVTAVAFLGFDAIGLRVLVKPVFETHLGEQLLNSPRYLPAGVFYAFYVGCLLYFVSWTALQDGRTLWAVFGAGALIGAMAYGTYEFTNLATLKAWDWRMVATDLTWGTLLTGTSATVGVAALRWMGYGAA
jgi:uncharacterized membrane protein